MCGIVGLLNWRDSNAPGDLTKIIVKMTECLTHRGPDDHGCWIDHERGNGFGHRRLSIVDLSKNARQPFWDFEGRYGITYNGEIYNFKELRAELTSKGISFRSKSDTEVLLEALKMWDLKALDRIDGMFAFAFFDSDRNRTLLARDRMGEKPMYWSQIGRSFAFASELSALRIIPGFDDRIDSDAVASYMYFQYLDGERAFYRGANKLLPGCWMTVIDGVIREKGRYFQFDFSDERDDRPLDQKVDHLESLLLRSIERRLDTDVPTGAFLSGGVDSALVVALIRKGLGAPIDTFSLGFGNTLLSEHKDARFIAAYLNTQHHEKVADLDSLNQSFQSVIDALDEPNADTSCFPTFLLSEFTRKHVKVALSGDGADELFGGYSRYTEMLRDHNRVGGQDVGSAYYSGHHAVWSLTDIKQILTEPIDGFQNQLDRIHLELSLPKGNDIDSLRRTDALHYLPGSVLSKVDRMSMHHGLEVRTPFLDPAIIAFALRMPADSIHSGSEGKVILKALAERYLPRDYVYKTKVGFSIPNDESWFAGVRSLLQKNDEITSSEFTLEALINWNLSKTLAQGNLFQLWNLCVLNCFTRTRKLEAFPRKNSLSNWIENHHNSTGFTEKVKDNLAPILFDRKSGSFLPFSKDMILDDLKDHLSFGHTIRTDSLAETIYSEKVSILRKDTPVRAWRILKELNFWVVNRRTQNRQCRILRELIEHDEGEKKDRNDPPQRIVYLIHDLASAGAQRQLCYHAIGSKKAGFDVSVVILWRFSVINSHYLPWLEKEKIPVFSCCYPNADDFFDPGEILKGEKACFFLSLQPDRRKEIWNLMTYLQMLKPCRLHCFVDFSCLAGSLATILCEIPQVIFSFRNHNPTKFNFNIPGLKPLYQTLFHSSRLRLSGNSNAGNNDYARWLGIDPDRIEVIHNGIDLQQWKPVTEQERKKSRSRFQIPEDTVCLLGIFQMEHYKRPIYFLDIIKLLVSSLDRKMKVLVVGTGKLLPAFRSAIAERELEGVVEILGRVEDIPGIMAAGDLLLLTSGYGEGTPNVILEAQARGIPIVATESGGGIREAVRQGESGWVLGDDDTQSIVTTCAKILNDECLKQQMGEIGRRHIEEIFSLEILQKNLIKFYNKMDINPVILS